MCLWKWIPTCVIPYRHVETHPWGRAGVLTALRSLAFLEGAVSGLQPSGPGTWNVIFSRIYPPAPSLPLFKVWVPCVEPRFSTGRACPTPWWNVLLECGTEMHSSLETGLLLQGLVGAALSWSKPPRELCPVPGKRTCSATFAFQSWTSCLSGKWMSRPGLFMGA